MKVYDDLPLKADGSIDLEAWVSRVGKSYPDEQAALLRDAALLSLEEGGLSLTPVQESAFRQGLQTAESLLVLQPDMHTLIATVLYFPAAYGELSLEIIENAFDDKIAAIIRGVMQLSQTHERGTGTTFSQRDNLRRMLLAIVEDVRVVLIKLAEQMIFLRSATQMTEGYQRELATQAREIYAPLANRLGIGHIKWEMEDYAFRYLDPKNYKQIAKLLSERRTDRDRFIQEVVQMVQNHLRKNHIDAEVYGRAKHIFSIWRKMQRKGLEFSDIYDVRALRILVPEIQDCYACLGIVHSLWQYIPQEFDDYIATPKENGYRSLHTAVVGPEGKVVEIQIRTFQMHKEAELGVAAHWLYKEGLRHEEGYHHKLATLRQILDWQEEIPPAGENEETTAMYSELFDDRVYVFTPRGDVIDLAKGATPLDFAYHIHSDVGHRCRGAKVNGAIVPLSYALQSGDQVEILAGKEIKPSRDWLNPHQGYLRTARAKAKVHQWLRQQDRDQNLADGREMLERELRRLGLDKPNLDKLANRYNFRKGEDIYVALGRGDVGLNTLLNTLQPAAKADDTVDLAETEPVKSPSRPQKKGGDVHIEGVGNLLCHYAKCCKPIPQDPIVGYITLGRGVTIHRKDCMQLLQAKAEDSQRLIQVQWGDVTRNVYPVDIGITAYDRKGLLNDITGILRNEKVNMTAVNTLTDQDNSATVFITLEISDLNILGKVLTRILQLPNVLEAYRVRPGQDKEREA